MRFAVAGAGFIGPINTKALLSCPGAELAAVVNRTESHAEEMCRKLGVSVPIYTDLDEMLEKEKPEAVVLSVFNDLHEPWFIRCAEAGAHVIVEKPMANRYEECLRMEEAAKKHGIRACVLHTQRYNAQFITAKAYIEAHRAELGKLIAVHDTILCNYFWDGRNPWHLDPVRSGGGIVMNYAVHQLDRVHFFLGEKTKEFHACYRTEKPGVDTCSSYTMMGVGDGGTPYSILCAGNSGPTVNELSLVYQNAMIKCVLTTDGVQASGTYLGDTASGKFTALPQVCDNGSDGLAMYERELREAVDYVTGRRDEAPVSLDWAAEMVRLCRLGFGEEF